MTKQEEIREGLAREICKRDNEDWDALSYSEKDFCREKSRLHLLYLHSQGAVIKVKCPNCGWSQFGGESVGMTPCHFCNSTGYIIEPLIKGD